MLKVTISKRKQHNEANKAFLISLIKKENRLATVVWTIINEEQEQKSTISLCNF